MNARAPSVIRLTPHLSALDCSLRASAVIVVIEHVPPSWGLFSLERRSSSFVIALAEKRNTTGAPNVFQKADAGPSPRETATKKRFRLLAEAQLPRLYTIARRLVGDEAEDAVQDALLKAYRAFDQLEHASAGPAWLASIVVNVCRDRGRARARAPAEVSLDAITDFSLYRKIADGDPFPYSDSLHLDFLGQF